MNPTGKITENFGWEEILCKGRFKGGVHEGRECEIPEAAQIKIRLLVSRVLQPLRSALGVPIKITSGYRCPAHNRACGGARHSQHMKGTAADIRVPALEIKCLHKVLDLHMRNCNRLGPGGMGLYLRGDRRDDWGFIHIDIRATERAVRWPG